MDKVKIQNDLRNSVAILESNIAYFYEGKRYTYLIIASELRKLICDKNLSKKDAIDNSLLIKIFSYISMHPITSNKKIKENNLKAILEIYGKIWISDKIKITDLFDESLPRIPLKDWLNQTVVIAGEPISIAQFIRSVSDKEAVHADKYYDLFIQKLSKVQFNKEDLKGALIIAIGEYVLEEIKYWAKPVL